jgi:hypothetical protein
MALNKFIPLSPDPYITSDPEMTLAKFGHLNTIVDYLNGTNALTNIKIAGINNTAGYIDFSANPTGSTTVVGAIRTYQDGTNLLPTLQFIESGDIYQSKYSGVINNLFFQDNAGVNMPNGTGVYQGDYVGRRNGATSTLFREAVTYNGNGTTRRGRYSMGVAEDSGFGAYQFVSTQYNNIKVNILGHGASAYIDDAVSPTTAYNIHAGNIINARTGLPLLSLDVDGLTKHVFQTNGNVSLNNTSDMSAILGVKGSGSTSATTSFLVQNSSNENILQIQDDRTSTFTFEASASVVFRNATGSRSVVISGANKDLTVSGIISSGNAQFANLNLTSTTISGFNACQLDLNGDNVILKSRPNTPSPIRLISGNGGAFNRGTVYVSNNSNLATAVNASAQLQVDAIDQGFLPPRMTTAQKNLIATPATGLQVHDTDLNRPCFYNGTSWVTL